jgi:hypothetical protein
MNARTFFVIGLAAALALPAGAQPAPASRLDPRISGMTGSVSAANLRALDERLVAFGTRNLYSETSANPNRGVYAARNWIRDQFQAIANSTGGRMTVAFDTYVQPKGPNVVRDVEVSSVIATLKGDEPDAPVYVMSSHYDSRNSDGNDPLKDAPGANDNGSATSAVIEAARVMARTHFRATIVFACFDGEEQGLFGSDHYAKVLHDTNVRVLGNLNDDIIGGSKDFHGHAAPYRIRLFSEALPLGAERAPINHANAENDSPSRELARFVQSTAEPYVKPMRVDLQYMDDRWGRGGDQQSFTRQGFAGVRFVEPFENYEHQHQDIRVEKGVQYGDLPRYVDFDYLARATKLNVAALAALALGPEPPSGVGEDRAGFTYVTKLKWTAAPGAVSYDVVWRSSTDVQWRGVKNVGNVTSVTLPMNKDYYQFGVRSVDASGLRSYAVHPVPVKM